MFEDEDFTPRLGRIGARGDAKRARRYLSRVVQAANLARGGSALLGSARGAFSGARIGRGSGVGRVLGSRDRFAHFRQRRVLIKTRIARLAGKGAGAAKAHLRYLERDGTTRDDQPGKLYDAGTDAADGKGFLERGAGDRHQFRFIVSAEDGADYEDLKPFTRRLMARMEEDLGTKLDWVAVDHFNTGHQHTHILLRGKDEQGRDLVIAREYIAHGMRERAAEIVSLDLGPRTDRQIEDWLRAEVEQERFTSIDRAFLREADGDRIVGPSGRDAVEQAIRAGRLQKLHRLGLAEPAGPGRWRLADELGTTLTRIGERGDIIRTMQREVSARGLARADAERAIYNPAADGVRPLVGRVLARGLTDELRDRHYLIVDSIDGRTHYVDIGNGEATDVVRIGAIVRVEPVSGGVHASDRTVAQVAAANDGRYSVDLHLGHDPTATETFAEAHVRRLEAIRRLTGGINREPDGTWVIAPNHLDLVAEYGRARAAERPVNVTQLSSEPLEKLIDADAATWLDRNLIAGSTDPVRDAGFGAEARQAETRRRQWLIEQGLAEERDGATRYRPTMLAELQRREVVRVAGQLSRQLGLPFSEAQSGEEVAGTYRRHLDLVSGRFAVIERSRDFTLVAWRPALERQAGKPVVGLVRDGGVSWHFGRERVGPSR